jgi:hypothetical protein
MAAQFKHIKYQITASTKNNPGEITKSEELGILAQKIKNSR